MNYHVYLNEFTEPESLNKVTILILVNITQRYLEISKTSIKQKEMIKKNIILLLNFHCLLSHFSVSYLYLFTIYPACHPLYLSVSPICQSVIPGCYPLSICYSLCLSVQSCSQLLTRSLFVCQLFLSAAAIVFWQRLWLS